MQFLLIKSLFEMSCHLMNNMNLWQGIFETCQSVVFMLLQDLFLSSPQLFFSASFQRVISVQMYDYVNIRTNCCQYCRAIMPFSKQIKCFCRCFWERERVRACCPASFHFIAVMALFFLVLI